MELWLPLLTTLVSTMALYAVSFAFGYYVNKEDVRKGSPLYLLSHAVLMLTATGYLWANSQLDDLKGAGDSYQAYYLIKAFLIMLVFVIVGVISGKKARHLKYQQKKLNAQLLKKRVQQSKKKKRK
jgi:hypothetical protein